MLGYLISLSFIYPKIKDDFKFLVTLYSIYIIFYVANKSFRVLFLNIDLFHKLLKLLSVFIIPIVIISSLYSVIKEHSKNSINFLMFLNIMSFIAASVLIVVSFYMDTTYKLTVISVGVYTILFSILSFLQPYFAKKKIKRSFFLTLKGFNNIIN